MAAKLKIGKRGGEILIEESFQKSLVEIGSVVSEENIFLYCIPPFF
jgi:hypothetical protein